MLKLIRPLIYIQGQITLHVQNYQVSVCSVQKIPKNNCIPKNDYNLTRFLKPIFACLGNL